MTKRLESFNFDLIAQVWNVNVNFFMDTFAKYVWWSWFVLCPSAIVICYSFMDKPNLL